MNNFIFKETSRKAYRERTEYDTLGERAESALEKPAALRLVWVELSIVSNRRAHFQDTGAEEESRDFYSELQLKDIITMIARENHSMGNC